MGVFWESPAAIVAKLEDSTWFLRKAAVEALGKLPAEALQAHADALVAKLEDSIAYVRQAAVEVLGKLPAEADGRTRLEMAWGARAALSRSR